jgi:aspartyl-tRNA(Asn)/glutamyl-tRNA(Gln) amidotransferase subunit A
VTVVRVTMPDLEAVNAAGALTTICEAASAHRPWMETRIGDYSPQVRARLVPGLAVPAVAYLDAQRVRAASLARFQEDVFGKVDALLAPTLNSVVPTIAETDVADGDKMPAVLGRMTRLSRPFNAMGLPSLSVPVKLDTRGVPLGLQIAGRPFDEATLFSLGAAFEREVPFHLQAPKLPA